MSAAAAAAQGSQGELELCYHRCGFLPTPNDADLTLCCTDTPNFFDVPNPHGHTNAFSVKKGDLAACSTFFNDFFAAASYEDSFTVHDEESETISLLLSAMLELSTAHLKAKGSWTDLNKALRLGVKWGTNKGRLQVLLAMLLRLDHPHFSIEGQDITEFLVEAAKRGGAAVDLALQVLYKNARQNGYCVAGLQLTHQHLWELDAEDVNLLCNTYIHFASDEGFRT